MITSTYLLDEQIPKDTLRRLRQVGIPIHSVDTRGIKGKKNGLLLEYCVKKKLCVITCDVRLIKEQTGKKHWGFILCNLGSTKDIVVGVALENFFRANSNLNMKGRIVIISDEGIKWDKRKMVSNSARKFK